MTIHDISIKVNSKAEKLAACQFLSKLGGVDIGPTTGKGEDYKTYSYVYVHKDKYVSGSSVESAKVYQFNEIAKLLIDLEEKVITIKLNNQYSAEVSKSGVKVGCQVFTLASVQELYKAYEEVMK